MNLYSGGHTYMAFILQNYGDYGMPEWRHTLQQDNVLKGTCMKMSRNYFQPQRRQFKTHKLHVSLLY